MGSVKFGFGATLGNKLLNGSLKLGVLFLVAGAVRSGVHEIAEEDGYPEDGINFLPGVIYDGAENVKYLYSITLDVLDVIKDDTNAGASIVEDPTADIS